MKTDLDYHDNFPCSVTFHLVHEVAHSEPEKFLNKNNEIKTYEVLHYLGFNIDKHTHTRDITEVPQVLIRNNHNQRTCYYADIYKGLVRNIKGASHPLLDEYMRYEVLQPTNLSTYVSDDELFNIDDFGGKTKLEDCMTEEV